MTRTTSRPLWRHAGIGLAMCCLLSATALSATAAEGEGPALIPVPEPAPPAAAEAVTEQSETPPELLATPREGSPSSYLLDAPEPSAPDALPSLRSLSAAAGGGSISGTITGWVTPTSLEPLSGALVYALRWDDALQDYDLVATVSADHAGDYRFDGLPAGDYIVLAADDDPASALLPEFWPDEPLAQWATEIAVTDGSESPDIDEILEPLFKDYIAGADRYATSVAISQAGFAEGAGGCVYIASGANFPDALSAAPAAAACGGPLLLVPPTATTPVLEAELSRLQPAEIVIAGGTGAIATSVETRLRAFAPTVRRIAGTDRYDTSRKIIADAFDDAPGLWVATGANFPDALSASGAAAAAGIPVLIVPGTAKSLDAASSTAIKNLGPSVVAIAGGTAVVSTGLAVSIDALPSVSIARFGGADRYATSLAINSAVWDVEAGSYSVYAFLTNGTKFPDALSGAPLAGGLLGAPLYVVPPVCTPAGVLAHVEELGVYWAFLLGYFSQLSFSGKPFQTC